MTKQSTITSNNKLTLSDALNSLHQRGKHEEKTALQQRIKTHFGDVLTEEKLLQTPLTELLGSIQIFNKIYPLITSNQDIDETTLLTELKEEIKNLWSLQL